MDSSSICNDYLTKKIEDFLEDKSEITVYSVEYGLTLKTLAQERDRLHINYSVFDQGIINEKFINKKTIRDKRNLKKNPNSRSTEVNLDDEFENPQMGTLEMDENNDQKSKVKEHKEHKQNKPIDVKDNKQLNKIQNQNVQNAQQNYSKTKSQNAPLKADSKKVHHDEDSDIDEDDSKNKLK